MKKNTHLKQIQSKFDAKHEEAMHRLDRIEAIQEQTAREARINEKRSDKGFKETRALLDEVIAKSKKDIAESKEARAQSEKRIKELDKLFNIQWGRLMESLVKGDLLKLLQKRNIKVDYFAKETEGKRNGEAFEFDIIAINGREIVVTEVKTSLRLSDVKYFLKKLKKATYYMPKYSDKVLYGAVAYLKANHSSEVYAEKNGLFVIRATGSSASIINDKDFKPKRFDTK